MKSFLILISIVIFARQAHAEDAWRVLKDYFDKSTEAAEITDFDEKDRSTDSPLKCVWASAYSSHQNPQRLRISRVGLKGIREGFGPLFPAKKENEWALVFDFDGRKTPEEYELDSIAIARSLTVAKESDTLVLTFVDHAHDPYVIKVRRNQQTLTLEINYRSGSYSKFAYCFRQ
jgi:hypothetical protein